MIGVFWNILIFILSTVAYFTFLKPQLTLDIVQNESSYRSYISSTHMMVVVYILGTILSQFFINSAVIINTCGGSSSKNIGTAALTNNISIINACISNASIVNACITTCSFHTVNYTNSINGAGPINIINGDPSKQQ